MNDQSQSRVQAGVPSGGQFAASARAEADVSLEPRPKTALPAPVLVPGEDGETLVREFSCESHDGPGECTQECTDLVAAMDGPGFSDLPYDPTGCSNGPERPYSTYEYDAQARASVCVTHVPEGLVLVRTLQKGQWVIVDGDPRKVDSVGTGKWRHDIWVDFESYDREPDGSPTGYLSRKFTGDAYLSFVDMMNLPEQDYRLADGQVPISTLQPGYWVYLDDEPRQVESVTPGDPTKGEIGSLIVRFTPSGDDPKFHEDFFVRREMPKYNAIDLVAPADIPITDPAPQVWCSEHGPSCPHGCIR